MLFVPSSTQFYEARLVRGTTVGMWFIGNMLGPRHCIGHPCGTIVCSDRTIYVNNYARATFMEFRNTECRTVSIRPCLTALRRTPVDFYNAQECAKSIEHAISATFGKSIAAVRCLRYTYTVQTEYYTFSLGV